MCSGIFNPNPIKSTMAATKFGLDAGKKATNIGLDIAKKTTPKPTAPFKPPQVFGNS